MLAVSLNFRPVKSVPEDFYLVEFRSLSNCCRRDAGILGPHILIRV